MVDDTETAGLEERSTKEGVRDSDSEDDEEEGEDDARPAAGSGKWY